MSDVQYWDAKRLNEYPRLCYPNCVNDHAIVFDKPAILSVLINFRDEKILYTDHVLVLNDNLSCSEIVVFTELSIFSFSNLKLSRRILYSSVNVAYYYDNAIGFLIPSDSNLIIECQVLNLVRVLKDLKLTVKNAPFGWMDRQVTISHLDMVSNLENPDYIRRLLKKSVYENVCVGLEYARMFWMQNETLYQEKVKYVEIYEQASVIMAKWDYYQENHDIAKLKKYLDKAKGNTVLKDFYKEKSLIYENLEANPFNEKYLNVYLKRCQKYYDVSTLKTFFSEQNVQMVERISKDAFDRLRTAASIAIQKNYRTKHHSVTLNMTSNTISR